MADPAEFAIEPTLYLRDGRIIETIADAIACLREQEARPGVDTRDEVLHRLERASEDEARQRAVEAFVQWAEELDLLVTPPQTTRREK
jgi:hypothetical protein